VSACSDCSPDRLRGCLHATLRVLLARSCACLVVPQAVKLHCDHTQTPPPLTCQRCLVMLVLPVLTLLWHQECDDVSDALLEAADNAGIIHPPNRRHEILKSEGSSHYLSFF
jgi:hypothetical protein